MKYSPLKTYLTFCRENSNISTKLAKLLNIRAVKQRPMEMSECGWDWWPGFIPLLWACTSEGPSWEALPTVAGIAPVGEAGGVSLQQHLCCLANGLLCALHEAERWEVEPREVRASWWSSWGAGPGPWRFRWALDPFHQGDLSAEQLLSTSWPQATPNPLSFPMLDPQTCAIRSSGWWQWHTSVRAHWQRNKPSLAQMS